MNEFAKIENDISWFNKGKSRQKNFVLNKISFYRKGIIETETLKILDQLESDIVNTKI